MSIVLAIDIGRTGCRAALFNSAATAPAATATGDGSAGLTASQGPDLAEAAILAVVKPLLETHHVDGLDAVGVGAAGAMYVPAQARQLAERLVRSLPARAVSVMSDAITSHAGALGGKPGVVLAAGTGAVALAIGTDRQFHQVDGRGPWLGDEGSGAWLGCRGLRAVARAGDGRGPATALSAAAKRQFGSIDQLAARLGSDPNPARSMAAFAPAVAAAARNGDPVAMRLVEQGAAALAASMIAAAHMLHTPEPVAAAMVGGLTNMGPVLLDPLRAALEQSQTHLKLQPAEGTSIDGARRLAVTAGGIHEKWIVRAHEHTGASADPRACGTT